MSLLYAYGQLWCGMGSNGKTTTIWYINLLYGGSDWTLEHTFTSGESIIPDLAIFQGQIYAPLYNRTLSGTVRIAVRDTVGTWTTSDSGTLDGNAGHAGNRCYHSAFVWPPEDSGITSPAPALYTSREGATEDTWPNNALRRLSGGTWSTVQASLGGAYFVAGIATNGTNLVPVLWDSEEGNALINTVDGTTWVDRSAKLTISGVLHACTALVFQI